MTSAKRLLRCSSALALAARRVRRRRRARAARGRAAGERLPGQDRARARHDDDPVGAQARGRGRLHRPGAAARAWASRPSARWTGSARARSASGRGSATAWGGKPPAIVSSKSYEIDFEKVAAQRPDLILGLYAELKRGDYDKLSKIAPTVAQAKGDPYTTPWRDMTRDAAKAVGRVDEGEQLIEETEARFAAFRKAHPETAEADRARGRRRHRAEELLPLQLQGPARPVPARARLPAVGEHRQAGRQDASAPRSPRSASTCSTSTGCSC